MAGEWLPRRRRKWNRFIHSVGGVALAFGLVACSGSDKPAVSLAEARQITAQFEAQGFTPPPRTISDIVAVLDSEKPDPTKYGRYTALADAQPPAGASTEDLARFYRDRAVAASQIGRVEQWIADAKEALRLADQVFNVDIADNAAVELVQAEMQVGNYATGVEYAKHRVTTAANFFGQLVTAHSQLASAYAFAGDTAEAQAEIDRATQTLKYFQGLPRPDPVSLTNAQGSAAAAIGAVYEVGGRYADAERQLTESIKSIQTVIRAYDGWLNRHKPAREVYLNNLVLLRLRLANLVARQGRLAEAESIARAALLDSLHQQGRYAPTSAVAVGLLANIILDEGRAAEAQRLAEAAVDIYQGIGARQGSRSAMTARLAVANARAAAGNWRDAMTAYDEAARNIGEQDRQARALFNGNLIRVMTEIKLGRGGEALNQVSAIAQRRTQLLGDGHPDTLDAEGLRAAALYAVGRREEALAAFRAVVPRLIQASRVSDTGEAAPILREMRLRFVLESYIDLLSETKDPGAPSEAFVVADVVRGQAVQRALAESAARTSVRDPALADLVRREQDARAQINALFGLLASIQAAPQDQRSDQTVAGLRNDIDRLRRARAALREEIGRRFPAYASLIDPRPVTIDQVRAALAPKEAMIAFYVGDTKTFVWAVPAAGPVAFAAAPLSAAQIAAEVGALRRALEPNAATLGDIPAFDVERAYGLYAALLAPVEAGWRSMHALLVVPHGALGELPLGLLPTAPAKLEVRSGEALFADYKRVPWLIRQVSVTQLPSATSLVSLRTLPPGDSHRRAFVGFGDPWFSAQQAAEAQRESRPMQLAAVPDAGTVATRGLPVKLRSAPKTETVDSAQLALLPRLPETAQEVREVAVALKADPEKDVFLGSRASEKAVRTMALDDRRVVMFATHGLVPGDLDGLREPALALSAPQVVGAEGDGLLTATKILGLRLNADWVVLSACNTAAGNGAGAEAVSGLGLAFFYAGTRAVLVSNWPVETTSARALTTGLFADEAAHPELTRGEALRQSMLQLMDGDGFVDPVSKRAVFSYAHPIFWAPFSLVGDGGGGLRSS